jgi:peptide/nickel transport system substrate-binding protein
MQNKFGLKDFILMAMVLAIGVIVVLAMVQRDREWRLIRDLTTKVDDLSRQVSRTGQKPEASIPADLAAQLASVQGKLAELKSQLDRGVTVSGDKGATKGATAPTGSQSPAGGNRDTSWARPGVDIAWQEPWDFATDPRTVAGYQEGGDFTEIYEAQLPKLTPFILTDVYGRRIVDVVCSSLGAYDPKTLKLRGVMADAWQMDPAGLWLRVRIRPDARFSDGEPVTAEDVRYTFHDYIMNAQIDAARERSTLSDSIDKVTPISERVVEFTFKDAIFLNLDNALTLFVLPKHFYSKFTAADINKSTGLLMGSGPYKMQRLSRDDQWTPPSDVVLVRNEQYWGPRPPLDMVRIRCMTDEMPRLTAFRNGEADLITPSTPQFATLSKDPEFAAENVCLNWVNMRCGNSFIAWNCGERNGKPTPFHDKRVRTAMTYLLNREKMILDIWKGLGQVSKGYFNPSSPGSDPALKALPFDPKKGAELLAEAGWKDRDGNGVLEDERGDEFQFEFTNFGGGEIAERIAVFVKDSYAAAGIKCNIRSVDWSIGEDLRKRRDFDAMTMAWSSTAPESDPKQIYHSNSIKDQGDNFAQWNSPAADEAIERGRRELDFAKRMKAWNEFERIMHDEQPYTWIRIQAYPRFVKPYMKNVNPYPKGLELWEYFRGGTASAVPAN